MISGRSSRRAPPPSRRRSPSTPATCTSASTISSAPRSRSRPGSPAAGSSAVTSCSRSDVIRWRRPSRCSPAFTAAPSSRRCRRCSTRPSSRPSPRRRAPRALYVRRRARDRQVRGGGDAFAFVLAIRPDMLEALVAEDAPSDRVAARRRRGRVRPALVGHDVAAQGHHALGQHAALRDRAHHEALAAHAAGRQPRRVRVRLRRRARLRLLPDAFEGRDRCADDALERRRGAAADRGAPVRLRALHADARGRPAHRGRDVRRATSRSVRALAGPGLTRERREAVLRRVRPGAARRLRPVRGARPRSPRPRRGLREGRHDRGPALRRDARSGSSTRTTRRCRPASSAGSSSTARAASSASSTTRS